MKSIDAVYLYEEIAGGDLVKDCQNWSGNVVLGCSTGRIR